MISLSLVALEALHDDDVQARIARARFVFVCPKHHGATSVVLRVHA